MAYITKFNSSRVIRQIDEKLIDIIDHNYYKKRIGFLSDQEIKRLIVYKKLLENTDDFFEHYYSRIKDTQTFIFENKPSFHKDAHCPNLHSSFDNIKIPDKIKEKGKTSIEEFRKWAKENYELYQNDREAFKARCCMKFGLLYPVDMRDVGGDNSGVDFKKNYNLQELEREIDKLIKDARDFYYSSDTTMTILSEYRNKMFLRLDKYEVRYNNTPYSQEEIKKVLEKQYKSFNEPVVWLLQEWLRINFNPELSFEGRLLEQLGFKNCPVCYSDYNPQTIDDDYFFNVETPKPKSTSPNIIEPSDDLPF